MKEQDKETLVKELIKCPTINKIYENQSWYYWEYVWDDWSYYMFNIYQELLEIYVSWRLDNKDKEFQQGLLDLICKK